jgi:hypothetical protein
VRGNFILTETCGCCVDSLLDKAAYDYFYRASSPYTSTAIDHLGNSTITAISHLVEAGILTASGCAQRAPSQTVTTILRVSASGVESVWLLIPVSPVQRSTRHRLFDPSSR